jgi:hypothetical protein
VSSAFEHILKEIEVAAEKGLPFLAVAMAVALPDICQSLANADGRSNGVRYKAWCSANLGDQFSLLTPDDLYSMRCGVLHNGRFGDMKNSVARVLFSLPGSASFTNCKFDDAYVYGIVDFCKNFSAAARKWYEEHKSDQHVIANSSRLMQVHENGISPYIVGIPLLG